MTTRTPKMRRNIGRRDPVTAQRSTMPMAMRKRLKQANNAYKGIGSENAKKSLDDEQHADDKS
jgi:hypothetical protein